MWEVWSCYCFLLAEVGWNLYTRVCSIQLIKFHSATTDKYEASTLGSQAISMTSTTHDYSLSVELEKKHVWFADSGASYHFTLYAHFLHIKKPYAGYSRVCVANGQSLAINYIVSSYVFSKPIHTTSLTLNDILYFLCITRNSLSVSKLSKDDIVVFEFLFDKCYVKSRIVHPSGRLSWLKWLVLFPTIASGVFMDIIFEYYQS